MSDIVIVVGVSCALALGLSLATAPLESLRWWAGWLGPDDPLPPLPAGEGDAADRPAGRPATGDDAAPAEPGTDGRPAAYVVFLSGIGSISGDELLPRERGFLDRLRRTLPEVAIVDDVFPYAPSGRSLLTGQRVFARLWRVVDGMRLRGVVVLPAILNIRNLFQVLVSADDRYGPIYSFAMARLVRDGLARRGYRADRPTPVVLIGFSGGGQVSIGAATYLRATLDAPIHVVSIGGVMASDRGIDAIEGLTRLYGGRDGVQRIGAIVFPGRWPVTRASAWNRAVADGRIVSVRLDGLRHAGRGGYMDDTPPPDGGAPPAERTARAVADAIHAALGRDPRPVA